MSSHRPTSTLSFTDRDQADLVREQAGRVLSSGGLVVFPTETVYGIAADVTHPDGLRRLSQVIGSATGRLTVHVPSRAAAGTFGPVDHPRVARLLDRIWPGPVTVVLPLSDDDVAERVSALNLSDEAAERVYAQRRIALRCPDHPAAQAVLSSVDGPIVAAAAGRAGMMPARTGRDAAAAMGEGVDLVIDGGTTRHAQPSTVVELTVHDADVRFAVLRPGVIDERYLRKLMVWTLLFVCSGNTCRSPMAAGLARKLLAEHRGIPPDELEAADLRIVSAGTFATSGMPASPEAVAAMAQQGVDLSRHRSSRLTREAINEADLVLCMTRAHQDAIGQQFPDALDKVQLLDPAGRDIQDPIGESQAVYERTAARITEHLKVRLKEQLS